MSESIYPSAPVLTGQNYAPKLEINASQEFRLSEVRKLKDFLKKEIELRLKCYNKYNKASSVLSGLNTGLMSVSILTGVGGIGLLATIISVLCIVIILESVALSLDN